MPNSLLYLAAVVSLGGAAKAETVDPLAVTSVMLDNGLRVFLSENHAQPEVFGAVVVKTGAKNDPPDNTGMAHYLEHMLFKGTQELGTTNWRAEQPHQARIEALYDTLGTADSEPREAVLAKIRAEVQRTYAYVVPNELDQVLRLLGGREVNAFTSYDETVYYNTLGSSQVHRWLEIYAHRFENPVFRLFPSELEAVYEEKNIAIDTTGYEAFRASLRAAFPDHPYGESDILGEVEHLRRPSLSVMRAYFETFYVPSNMALVLSGDFETEAVLATVRRTFGAWKAGPKPPPTRGVVKPFQARQRATFRATPIRAGAVVYRTVPERHPDYAALAVIRKLLSNDQHSGLVDAASDSGRLLFAEHVPADFADHNLDAVVFVPRVVSQSFRAAENAAVAPFHALARGDFDVATFEATKAALLQDEARRWEDNEERALAIGHAFVARGSWQAYLDYLARLQSLTKADVVRVAHGLFGEHRLHVRSRVGFPKKARLNKPEVPPVTARPGAHSRMYRRVASAPVSPPRLQTVDFRQDLQRRRVRSGVELVAVHNPHNSLFELELRFGIGHLAKRELQLVAELIPRLGTARSAPAALRDAWFAIGSTLEVESELDALVVRVHGPHAHFDAALRVLSQVLLEAKPDREIWRQLRRERWGLRRLALRDASVLGEALRDFALHGDLSASYRDYGPRGARRISARRLVEAWVSAQRYAVMVRYAGPAPVDAVAESVRRAVAFRAQLRPGTAPVVLPRRLPERPTVYFLPRRDAVQSHIWFAVDGPAVAPADAAAADAFGEYFGGGMAGLVFQEIREFRALAYSAAGRLYRDARPRGASYLLGYVGCQADKTHDAIRVMLELLTDMPRYPDRMDVVRASLMRGLETSSPSFRELASVVAQWSQRGYAADPRPDRLAAYAQLTFADLESFYAHHVQAAPVAVMIVGDPRTVERAQLAEYGRVIDVSVRDVLSP